MTKEEIMKVVELALEKGKIDYLHITVKPSDERPCGLFTKEEVKIFESELNGEFKGVDDSHYLFNEYRKGFYKDDVRLSFSYSKSKIDDEISQLETKLAVLKTKKENQVEEVC